MSDPSDLSLGSPEDRAHAEEYWPEVDRFAVLMKAELMVNAHKGGWEDERAPHMVQRIFQEWFELRDLLRDHKIGTSSATDLKTRLDTWGEPETLRQRIASECADIANFAMMVADICGALGETPAEGDETGRR